MMDLPGGKLVLNTKTQRHKEEEVIYLAAKEDETGGELRMKIFPLRLRAFARGHSKKKILSIMRRMTDEIYLSFRRACEEKSVVSRDFSSFVVEMTPESGLHYCIHY